MATSKMSGYIYIGMIQILKNISEIGKMVSRNVSTGIS